MSASLDSFVQSRRPAMWALAERCAARLAGMPLSQLMLDANRWASEALAVGRLLDGDAVVFGGCDALYAEAAGAAVDWSAQHCKPVSAPSAEAAVSARWRGLLAAVARVAAQRPAVATFVLLPGPARFSRLLLGRADEQALQLVKPMLTRLLEQICDTRPTAVLLREGPSSLEATGAPAGAVVTSGTPRVDTPAAGASAAGGPAAHVTRAGAPVAAASTDALLRIFSTLRNIARHFDLPLGFAVSDLDPQTRDLIARSKPELALWLGEDASPPPSVEDLVEAFAAAEIAGIALDVEADRPMPAEWRRALAALDEDRWFINAHAEVNEAADLARIRARVPQLRAAAADSATATLELVNHAK